MKNKKYIGNYYLRLSKNDINETLMRICLENFWGK